MKKVYLDTAGRMHRAYRLLLQYPPNEYEFVDKPGAFFGASGALLKKDLVVDPFMRTLCRLLPLNLFKSYMQKYSKIPDNTDLTYSCGHLVLRNEPWVIELEWPTQLTGFYFKHMERTRGLIERFLASDNCKAIICMSELTRETMLRHLDCRNFEQKLEVIYRAIPSQDLTESGRCENDKIKLLFVGSANIPGEFENEKGGKEALEVFKILNERYNNLEFIVRSDVPRRVKNDLMKAPKVRLIDSEIPWKEMEKVFGSADICLLPAHHTPSLTFLDAMSYELPVVTIDSWANSEIVEDGKTGFVVEQPIESWLPVGDFLPIGKAKTFNRASRPINWNLVERLVEKTSLLIENQTLRRRMGRAGWFEVNQGKFSIKERNRRLEKTLDKAIVSD